MRLSFLYIAALAALAIGKANATSSLRDMKRASIDMHRKAVVWSSKHVATPIRRQSRQLSRAFNAAASTAKTDFVRAANNGDVATTISLEVVRSLAREVKDVVMVLKYIKEVVAQIPASSKHASVSLLKNLKAHANMKALGRSIRKRVKHLRKRVRKLRKRTWARARTATLRVRAALWRPRATWKNWLRL